VEWAVAEAAFHVVPVPVADPEIDVAAVVADRSSVVVAVLENADMAYLAADDESAQWSVGNK